MQLALIAAACAVLAGCASHTGVVPMGQDTFMLAKQAATGFSGLGNLKAELIAEASGHCQKAGKNLQITATRESQPPYILGNYPRAEIEFMCLSAGDRELQRPRLEPVPNVIIQNR